MKGLIKKDLYLIKNNWKSLIIFILVYIFISADKDGLETFIVPFMMSMLAMSTFSYDEYNKWDAYATTLPEGRNNVIKAKYLTTLILIVAGTLITFGLSITLGLIKGTFDINSTIESTIAGLASGILVIAIMFPLIIKLGLEKGRIAIVVISFGFSALLMLLVKTVKMPHIQEDYIQTFLPFLTALVFTGSYLISKKIYSHKEF